MKDTLKIVALTLAVAAFGQSAYRAYADVSEAAKFRSVQLENRVVLMLEQKAAIEAQGGKLSEAQQRELARALSKLSETLKTAVAEKNEPGI